MILRIPGSVVYGEYCMQAVDTAFVLLCTALVILMTFGVGFFMQVSSIGKTLSQ